MVGDQNDHMWSYEFLFSEAFCNFIELIPEGVILSNIDGNIILTNGVAEKVFGYSKKEFTSRNIEELVPESIRKVHPKLRADFFEHPTPRFLESRHFDLCAVRESGEEFPMESSLFRMLTDKGAIAVNIMRDVSKLKDSQAKVREYAFEDALTGLPNRRYFDEHFKRSLSKAKRHSQQLALIYLDLDNFKPINDNEGHDIGDQVLQIIARRLEDSLREEDFLARIGGDEFAVVIYPYVEGDGLIKVLNRIIKAGQEKVALRNKTFQLGISAGASISSETHDKKLSELLNAADKAMYKAKKGGGNQYVIYEE